MQAGNRQPTLKERLAYEKNQMPPVQAFMVYTILPIYIGASLVLLGLALVLMEIDSEKFLIPFILCFALWGLMTAAVLAAVPLVRRRVVREELLRYDFDTASIPEEDTWDYSSEAHSLQFTRHGIRLDEHLYYYNHVGKRLITGNYCSRVRIHILFTLPTGMEIPLPMNPRTIKMVQSTGIVLENHAAWNYLLANKEKAFSQIYQTGLVKPK